MRIAFYAPLKSPDHPVPSGDRQMARLLIEALRAGGHVVDLVSRLRSFVPVPDEQGQTALLAEAAAERETVRAALSDTRPDLWLTYHNHYKAPDLLGPACVADLGIPYILVEASHAPKRAAEWGCWHEAAEAAIRAADLHLAVTARDREGLLALPGFSKPVLDLPPFLDTRDWPAPRSPRNDGLPRLVTVAMMREGDKLSSYRFLAQALNRLHDRPWTLSIVGDGPARGAVEAAFAVLPPERLRWRGAFSAEGVRDELAAGDIYVWPGFGEAFGFGYLEAQAMGLPVIALDVAGVSSVVDAGETGLLVARAEPEDYAAALGNLLDDEDRRRSLGETATRRVRQTRTLDGARERLDAALKHAVLIHRGQDAALAAPVNPPPSDPWEALEKALRTLAATRATVDLWFRDDDAVTVTPALERLASLCERFSLPVMLAVIPDEATDDLATFVAGHPLLLPIQHGFAHRNRAAPGERARELGGPVSLGTITDELRQGQAKLLGLFGTQLLPMLVPPWNRIDDTVVAALPHLGFEALSTFGDDSRGAPTLRRLNSNLDIIDWRNGRVGHSHAKLASKLATLIEAAATSGRPIGLLAHHLVHDETAWGFLEGALIRLAASPGIRFVAPDHLLKR